MTNNPIFRTALLGAVLAAATVSTPAFAAKIKYKNCSKTDERNIKDALSWLKNNMSKVDRKMGKNGLKDWPGGSRKKFVKKLDKNLKFVCKNDKRKCKKNKDGSVLMGKVVPVFKQKTIQLCTNNFFDGQVNYVATIAHEIAHLIRLNAHRTSCKKKYEKPRFSQSVGLAAYHAYKSSTYKASNYTRWCK